MKSKMEGRRRGGGGISPPIGLAVGPTLAAISYGLPGVPRKVPAIADGGQ
jgi:hypothetical protein